MIVREVRFVIYGCCDIVLKKMMYCVYVNLWWDVDFFCVISYNENIFFLFD